MAPLQKWLCVYYVLLWCAARRNIGRPSEMPGTLKQNSDWLTLQLSLPSWWEVVLKDCSKPYKMIPISIEPPACLVNEECSASFLGATSRCILQLHALSCLHSEAFVRRRCYSKVGTPAEFKWCSPEWSNARRLARHSTFYSLILIVNLKIGEQLLMAWLAVFTQRHTKVNSRACVFRSFALCVLQREIWVWLVVLLASTAIGRYSWLTCGINSLSDELPWLDLKEDVYDWGLFLLRPPPQLPAC